MPSTVVYAKDFDSFLPVIDPRRLPKPAILNMANCLHDLDGPRSAFATKFANYVQYAADNRNNITELPVGNDIWFGTPQGIYRHDPVTGELVPMLVLSSVSPIPYWPWTVAAVGGYYYFTQYGVGLWQYNPLTNAMSAITIPVAAANIKWLTSSYGRLVILVINSVADIVAWSALDDGTDFVPSLTTGAGAQTCGLAGRVALRVDGFGDGFITTTTTGLMKSTFIGTSAVFAHRLLSPAIKVFSPNAGVMIPDLGLILTDPSGMYLVDESVHFTDRGEPKPWQPLMGAYFKDNQLKYMDRTKIGCINLHYSQAMKALFVSFAPNSREGNFAISYVFLTRSEKWGIFNKSFWGIFDVILPNSGIQNAAYMSYDGYMQYFVESYQSDSVPSSVFSISDLVWRPPVDQIIEQINDVYWGVSTLRFPDYDPTFYSSLTQFGTYYWSWAVASDYVRMEFTDPPLNPLDNPIYGITTIFFYPEGSVYLKASPYTLPTVGLASTLDIALVRFEEQKYADETSFLSGVIFAISPVVSFTTTEDWNVLIGDEDWNTEVGNEDWGLGSGFPDNFDLTLISTNDGFNPGAQGEETLVVGNNMGGSLTYSPQGWAAIYHRFRLDAENPGQGFAVKEIDVAGELAGRMTFNG